MNGRPTLLIVAKAPVPGLAKTRIAAEVGDRLAAELAAAALLDTLATARASGLPLVVALTGSLSDAARADELAAQLASVTVIEQRGTSLGARLAAAHADADRGHGVIQIGMDTPQINQDDYSSAALAVMSGHPVIGPAADGGWWLLGLPDGRSASVLTDIPMSQEDTCARTVTAVGGSPRRLRTLTDMDEWIDALDLADQLRETQPTSQLVGTVDHLLQEIR